MPQQIVILCAANRAKDGTIVTGQHHFDERMHCKIKRLERCAGEFKETGFIGPDWKFYSRTEAAIIAKQCGQRLNRECFANGSQKELFSECLYPDTGRSVS